MSTGTGCSTSWGGWTRSIGFSGTSPSVVAHFQNWTSDAYRCRAVAGAFTSRTEARYPSMSVLVTWSAVGRPGGRRVVSQPPGSLKWSWAPGSWPSGGGRTSRGARESEASRSHEGFQICPIDSERPVNGHGVHTLQQSVCRGPLRNDALGNSLFQGWEVALRKRLRTRSVGSIGYSTMYLSSESTRRIWTTTGSFTPGSRQVAKSLL